MDIITKDELLELIEIGQSNSISDRDIAKDNGLDRSESYHNGIIDAFDYFKRLINSRF